MIYYHRPKRARQIKERQEKLERERKYYEDKSNLGCDNGVVYDQPPPYEFQTVALNFPHDDKVDGGQDEPSETPVFIDDNKVTERNICMVVSKWDRAFRLGSIYLIMQHIYPRIFQSLSRPHVLMGSDFQIKILD